MQLEQRYKATFSRREVTEALKAHFADSLPVQALPTTGDKVVTTPVVSSDPDSVTFSWTRIASAGPI